MVRNIKKLRLINRLVLILNIIVIILFSIYILRLFFLSPNNFRIKEVRVYLNNNNLTRISNNKIEEIIKRNVKGNILIFDIDKARSIIEGIKWIDSVKIRKIWPSRIDIYIQETSPIARWNDCCLIDSDGNILNIRTDDFFTIFESDFGVYDDYIRGLMIDMYDKVSNKLSKSSGIYIHKLKLSNILSWSILLNNGLLIKLGRGDIIRKLERFIIAWELFLKYKKDDISYIDMRYDDGLSVFYKNID